MKALRKLALLLLLLAPALPAAAQESCRIPDPVASAACPTAGPARGAPGAFDFYMLSFSWSPAFCASEAGQRSPVQCRDNRFGWVVHGLWPQYAGKRDGQAWPQYCAPVSRLPEAVLRRHLCTLPDTRLMQCQWAKHGSCSDFAEPAAYFAAIEGVRDRLALPAPQPGQSGRAYRDAVLAANPGRGLRAGHLQVVAGQQGVREVRVCYSRDLTVSRDCD